jgi:site-specific DNA recombinase
MTPAAIYTRVSSREQQQEGFSLEAQSRLLRDYARRNHLRIVQSFEDVETAKAKGRKQFARLVEFFKGNRSCRVLLVEKTDRISRNFHDAVTLEDLDIVVHLVKEGQILSKDSKSQAVLVYGFNLVMARHYSNNLREEVKKGMREKAAQGTYPGHAPFGYRNNKAERTIEIDPVDSPIVKRVFALYATGSHSITSLRKVIEVETGRKMSRNNLYLILHNRFYIGSFEWSGKIYAGSHLLFLDRKIFDRVQQVLAGHKRPSYSRREITFRGLMQCAYDGCSVTGEVQKEKYVYYRCTGNRGKCDLPRFREKDIARRLGEPLKGLQVSEQLVARIVSSLRQDLSAERAGLESRLAAIRGRQDQAYTDKLDGKIPEDFWERRMSEWRKEEQQLKAAIDRLDSGEAHDRTREVERVFELANSAYSLYVSHGPAEKASLLKRLFSNCTVDAVNVTPTYRKPFDMIFERADLDEWSKYLWDSAPPSV